MAQPNYDVRANPASGTSIFDAEEAQYEVFEIKQGSTVLEAFQHVRGKAGVIYCVGGLNTNGTPQALASTLYIGRRKGFLLDSRTAGEEGIPFVIPEAQNSAIQSLRVYVYGDAGDKLILLWR
jgi:hypothetical protein